MTEEQGNMANIISSQSKAYNLLKLSLEGTKYVWMLVVETRENNNITLEIRTLGSTGDSIPAGFQVMIMECEANANSKTLKFTKGYITVEDPWKGLLIGTYVMNRAVKWAIDGYPSYRPTGIELYRYQAQVDNKERRNQFYNQFGFLFIWKDNDRCEGVLEPTLRVNQLHTSNKWQEKIEETSITEGLKDIFAELLRIRLGASISTYEIEGAKNAANLAYAASSRATEKQKTWKAIAVALFILLLMLFYLTQFYN